MTSHLILGSTTSGKPLLWGTTENPHAAIAGRSGSGKSYFIKGLANQAVRQGALVLALDYSGDLREYDPPEDLPFRRIDVLSPEFTVNPLVGAGSPDACAQQLLSIMRSVFRFGSRSTTALWSTTRKYLASGEDPSLEGLLEYASNIQDRGKGLKAMLEPLELMTALLHSGNQAISLDLFTPRFVVLDFSNIFDPDMRKLFVEVVLQSLWNQRLSSAGHLAVAIILILDECQLISWGKGSMSIKVLREGRKYGIAGWFSTQWLSNKDAVAALGQAALQAHFRPDNHNVTPLARKLCQGSGDMRQYQQLVSSLRQGQFLWQRPDGRVVIVNVTR